MVTRFRVGTNRPTQRFNLHVSTISPIPKSYPIAFRDPNWYRAMLDEYTALIKNNTWILVPRPPDANIVRSMWLFRHKYNADGTLSRYKARLVANGSTQLAGIDVDERPLVRFAAYAARVGFIYVAVTLTPLNRHGIHCLLAFIVMDIVLTASSSDLMVLLFLTLHYIAAWGLQYLTFTRPDISYAVQQVCLFMHDPREPHLSALKRILRYVRGTLSYGLQLYSSTTSSLVAYSDADWAGCPTTRRSTSGYCVFLGNNLLSWSSKRQFTLSRSSAEAEYRGVANAVAETCWLRNLLRELHTPLATATLVYCDNVSAVYLSSNPVQHQRTKHIEIDIHFVRDLVATGAIRVLHVPSRYQYADIFTKGLPTSLFDEFRTSLSVRCPPAPTAGECYPNTIASDHGVSQGEIEWAETCWLRNLLRELHTPLSTSTIVYCDNVSAVYLSSNLVQHQRTKHIEIDIHFVCDLVTTGHIRVLHVPSRYQYADIFTKGLPTALFDEFRDSLSVRSSPAQTAEGC
ncbi:ribonuclease H-like domain-containing protein [Tanacetum coccineum]|uniref:Ribonuclease H-like domain-containing protein n=1 Tax=Tanacetum coccineum TaxID=301880 RepID=A0ABQ5HWB2_9ASTR